MKHHFFNKPTPLSLKAIYDLAGIEIPSSISDEVFHDVAPLSMANKNDISFCHSVKYLKELSITKAGVVVVPPELKDKVPSTAIALESPAAYRVFGKICSAFYPRAMPKQDISPLASIDPSATVGANTQIEPFVVIKKNARVGANSFIKAHTVVSEGVVIGDNAYIEENVTLAHCIIGKDAYIKSGARIGQSGFGFHMDEKGHFDIPQLGCVKIGDDVQIGANTTIDRGSQEDTVIGNQVRIDNLVQIAHNVVIGDGSVLVAQVGVAGSTTLGKFVIAAGQVGIAGHIKIGNFVKIAAQSGIMRNVGDNETVAGSPAIPVTDWHRQTVILKQLIRNKKSHA